MPRNPLIIPILDILKIAEDKIGEYDLICSLEQQGIVFPGVNDSYNVAMFKKHFMTMNALYHLQQDLIEDGYYLSITVLDIRIEPLSQTENNQSLIDSAEHKVRDYYLDWRHFDNTSENEIKELLSSFWQMYSALDKQGQALAVLELDPDAGWDDVKQAYRRLATEHHPDKGGKDVRFIEIREAYEVLRCFYSQG
ncbi:MAG: DnaJ domain-containing protein [Gammaproteobacteria bacterium]|nr:DnaJ domain-containing protein [Gammaproteobacteria bacterium]